MPYGCLFALSVPVCHFFMRFPCIVPGTQPWRAVVCPDCRCRRPRRDLPPIVGCSAMQNNARRQSKHADPCCQGPATKPPLCAEGPWRRLAGRQLSPAQAPATLSSSLSLGGTDLTETRQQQGKLPSACCGRQSLVLTSTDSTTARPVRPDLRRGTHITAVNPLQQRLAEP